MKVFSIPALRDNYIWALVAGKHCIVVDPGDAAPVLQFLDEQGLGLSAVLITHRHHDHVDGLPALLASRPAAVAVFGPGTIAGINHAVGEGTQLAIAGFADAFKVWAVPGHTEEHLAYLCGARLFCGDTLFSAGCGRIMGGSAAQLHLSLQRLASLPESTLIYCTHEYTLANLRFARAVEPDNPDILARIEHCQAQREQGLPTLPCALAEELITNPFLRCHLPTVQARIRQENSDIDHTEVAYFTALRQWKDRF